MTFLFNIQYRPKIIAFQLKNIVRISQRVKKSHSEKKVIGEENNREDGWTYFVHGTTLAGWGDIKIDGRGIDSRGVGDFGQGFYTFPDDRWGRERAFEWAQRKARDEESSPVLVCVRMKTEVFNSLTILKIPDEDLDSFYENFYPDKLTVYELVVGSVGKNQTTNINTKNRVADKSYPDQYKFEGKATDHLKIWKYVLKKNDL